jgi:hypothetical protein
MNFRPDEVEFLAAWAQEERATDPYLLPAHQLQAAHGIKGVALICLVKAWACSEGRRDEDIFNVPHGYSPPWPWSENDQRLTNLMQAARSTNHQ